ncbi:MAG: sigma-70 family RNA polymerase sigma factor [Planctomycetes bacterium]|nr:sigma-70 family RNA polymerase sigma factor [Planctomycetota bacterium]
MDDLTDEQRMLMIKFDNVEAFDALFRKHAPGLTGYLWRSCGDRDAAEDLVQETFLNLYRSRKTYEPTARFSTWLYTIARNACANRRVQGARERARTRRVAEERLRAGKDVAPAADGPHERAVAAEEDEALAAGLERLPERQREVLLLREVAGLAYEEIARVARMPMGTVKTELHRARRRLAEALAERESR